MDFLMEPNFFQWSIAFLALVFALMVVLSHNPVVSAVSLMGTMFMTAGMYLALGSYFMGAVQILIYAGAVAVLFVFIVMLLDVRPTQVKIPGKEPFFALCAVAVVGVLAFSVIALINASILKSGTPDVMELSPQALEHSMTAKSIANYFLSKHMIPFQATGFIILASILGVVFLGRKPTNGHSVEDV